MVWEIQAPLTRRGFLTWGPRYRPQKAGLQSGAATRRRNSVCVPNKCHRSRKRFMVGTWQL